MMLSKVADDLLLSGSTSAIKCFVRQLTTRFKVIIAIFDSTISFNGRQFHQDAVGFITMDM